MNLCLQVLSGGLVLSLSILGCNSMGRKGETDQRERKQSHDLTDETPSRTENEQPNFSEKRERFAAIFYFSGFGDSLYAGQNIAPNGDIWVMKGQTPVYGPYGSSHFWGVPLWVKEQGNGNISESYRFHAPQKPNAPNHELLNWHAQLLTDAQIDLVVLDFTNGARDFPAGPSYISGTRALLQAWKERKERGLRTPRVAFFVKNEAALLEVEKQFFTRFPADLFFEYRGKKLLLVAAPLETLGNNDPAQPAVPTHGRFANYTTRHCWGLNSSGSYWQFKTNADNPPPPFYFNGYPEQLSAAVSTQATYMTKDGKTVLGGARGRDSGNYFIRQMDAAIQNRVTFVFIHSWNEWAAGNWGTQEAPHFVDQWLTEYSSDIEPMAGGHGWFYYDLMKSKVAEFKRMP